MATDCTHPIHDPLFDCSGLQMVLSNHRSKPLQILTAIFLIWWHPFNWAFITLGLIQVVLHRNQIPWIIGKFPLLGFGPVCSAVGVRPFQWDKVITTCGSDTSMYI